MEKRIEKTMNIVVETGSVCKGVRDLGISSSLLGIGRDIWTSRGTDGRISIQVSFS